jgi:hypothetical protein
MPEAAYTQSAKNMWTTSRMNWKRRERGARKPVTQRAAISYTRQFRTERKRVRILLSLICASVLGLTLGACSQRSNTMSVSPPLPPAEEPADETKGAVVGDAGAKP